MDKLQIMNNKNLIINCKVRTYYNKLKEFLGDLLQLEKIKTFQKPQLNEWINTLRQLSLECPCSLFGYNIEKDNCPIYECKDLDHSCNNICEKCKVSCQFCLRGTYWNYIGIFINNLDSYRNTNIWFLLICLYLAEELQKIRESSTQVMRDLSIEVSDFQFIKGKD